MASIVFQLLYDDFTLQMLDFRVHHAETTWFDYLRERIVTRNVS